MTLRYSLTLLCCAIASSIVADAPPQIAAAVDELVQPYLDAEIVNAVSIGVLQKDTQWTRHYGQLSVDQPSKPDDSTIYELGSISKVFTGILLADAVVAQRLRLDQPINDFLPQVKAHNQEVGDSIELQHLSTHVSGLPRMPGNMQPADVMNPYADYDRNKMIEFMTTVRPARKPGTKGEYSNLAVGLLGEILAMEAGKTYEMLLEKNLTKPLKMSETSVTLSSDQRQHLAPPHNSDRQPDKNWDLNSFAGAGGIRSNTIDMLTFVKAQLNPSDDQIGKAIQLAWSQHLPEHDGAFAMGLGWHIARDGHTRWHNGQTGGYHTAMFVDRRTDIGIIVLCNTATGEIDALAESIIQSLAGMQVKPRSFPKLATVEPETAARLAGTYRISPNFALTVRAEGEKLFLQATGQPEVRIYPNSNTQWRLRVVDAQLTFDLPEEGPCRSVTLHQNGLDLPAPRQTE